MYSSALGAFQPLLVHKLHLSLKRAGLIGGVMILFSSVMQPVYGYLSDRLHTRMFSALAPAVAGIFVACLGLAPGRPERVRAGADRNLRVRLVQPTTALGTA